MEAVILIASMTFTLGLALVVFLKNATSATNRLFAIFSVLMGVESLFYYLSLNSDNALLYIRLVMMNTVFIALIFKWIAVYLMKSKFIFNDHRLLELGAALSMGLLTLSPIVFSGVNVNEAGNITPEPQFGIVGFLAIMIAFMALPLVGLIRYMRRSSGLIRTQLQYIIGGVGITFVLAVISNFVFAVILKNSSFVSFTPVYLSIFAAAMWIAIARHRLFNIRMVIARSLAYVLLLGTIALIYAAGLFAVSRIFFASSSVGGVQNAVYIALAIIIAFTFQPMRQFFEKATDRIFFKDRYDSQTVLSEFSKILVSEIELDRLLRRTLADICARLHIEFGQFVIFNNDHVYRVENYGKIPQRLMVAPELLKLNRAVIVADELEYGTRKEVLERHSIRVSLQLRTREQFVGYLLLGDKLSGDIYSQQDIELLEIIAKQLAVAVLNAKAYAEIQEFNHTLQQRVDHATARLRVANRHLKELDRAKDEFISMASHQLRTPLTTIKGYLSMMQEGDAGTLTKDQDEFVGYAFTASERMVNLISDLLNVSRLSAGRFLIQTKPTDMVGMIRDEVRQLQSHADAKGLQLVLEAPDAPLPPAEIDDNKTRQVVMNFIDNAIYYTPTGTVTVKLEQTEHDVTLRVVDSGIGVPKDAQKKLFGKFFRAGNAQSVRPDGTGLGLYLAKRVVEDQGGTIIFESAESKGSTFGFVLPLAAVTKEGAHAGK